MTITNGYATLAEIKAMPKIGSTDATDDTFIEDLVEIASRYIDTATGRRFWVNTNDETRTYKAACDERVYTDDIVSVTSLKIDVDGDRTYETTWATTDYDLLPENASLDSKPYNFIQTAPLGRYSFPCGQKGVQIVGKFGWSAIPDPIHWACMLIVMTAYRNRFGQNTEGAATITGAGVVITPKDIPAGAADIIKQFTRITL